MDTEIQAYASYFEKAHEDLRSVIDSLNQNSLHWTPLENETNSPAVLITHMLGAERFRIHQVVAGVDIQRDRESEFQVTTATKRELLLSLKKTTDETRDALSRLTNTDLDDVRPAAREYENAETARWHVLHTIEHFGIHLGHLSLTMQLYKTQHQ